MLERERTMLRPKVLLPLAILAAASVAATFIAVHNFATSSAGPPRPSHGAARISADAAIRALTDHLAPGEYIRPGTAHATLTSLGSLSDIAN